MEAQEPKELDLSTGDILLHHKTGGKYVVQELEVYFSEMTEVYGGIESPLDVPCVKYQSETTGKVWVRPRFMFTTDRFQIIGNIYS